MEGSRFIECPACDALLLATKYGVQPHECNPPAAKSWTKPDRCQFCGARWHFLGICLGSGR